MVENKKTPMDYVRDLVILNGDKIEQGTQQCKEWQFNHKNCFGCQSELGCAKMVHIGLIILASNENNGDKIEELIDKSLTAKTVSEVRVISVPEMTCRKS